MNKDCIRGENELPDIYRLAGFVIVIIIATVLRFYHLNSQMWLDEYSAILQTIRRPWTEIVSVYPGSASHVLYELLANWSSTLFGESAFSVRLPAALFGIAGVVVLARLGARIHTNKSGLFIAALMAVSYHHIFFSQNARGYTALIFFFLWSSFLFLQIVENRRMEAKTGLVYCLATVLTCYCQPFGVFIPVSQFLIALSLFMSDTKRGESARFPIKGYIKWMAAAGVITLILYAPFIEGMMGHARMNIEAPAEGPRFDLGLLIEILEGLSSAFFGYAGLAIATLIGALGVIIWIRIHAASFFILSLPIVIQASVFVVMGVGIHPRYFAIAIPVIYVAGGILIIYLTEYVLLRVIHNSVIRPVLHGALLSMLIIISAYPLIRYYSLPKQDYQGALKLVERESKPEDIRAGVQTVGTIMASYYGADYVRVDVLEDLLLLEKPGDRVWVVMTLERIMALADPGLVNHVRNNYDLLDSFPGTVGDGSIQVYVQKE